MPSVRPRPTLTEMIASVARELPTSYLVEQRNRGIAYGGRTPLWPEVREAIETTLAERDVELEGA